MAILYPKSFKESKPANFDGLFDWDFLKPAFNGTKIEPTDIDAVVERHGNFLIFETKSPGKNIPEGQKIMYERLGSVQSWLFDIILGVILPDKENLVGVKYGYHCQKMGCFGIRCDLGNRVCRIGVCGDVY